MNNRHATILLLSLPLTALIIIASAVGILTPGFYGAETANWQAQSFGQDMIDLMLIAPCLLASSLMAYKQHRIGFMIYGGVTLYLTYTFTIYCFAVHFNSLFLVYCLCLGLSLYAFVHLLFTYYSSCSKLSPSKHLVNRLIAWYFIFISIVFYCLWLSEIIPAMLEHTTPKSIAEAGLFTNAVHVLDLSVILPAIFITGILLLKRNAIGYILTPILLAFFVLMNITIGMLVVIMKAKGIAADLGVSIMMGVLALLSVLFFVLFLKTNTPLKET